MTRLPDPLQTGRKDIDTLITHQTDTPYLQGGWVEAASGDESVLAFLMRLYAYFFVTFSQDLAIKGDESLGGTDILKEHLLTSGPYAVVTYKTNFHLRPDALKVRPRPAAYRGLGMRHWFILFPGAIGDRFFATGRIMTSFQYATRTCRVDDAVAITIVDVTANAGGYRLSPPFPLPGNGTPETDYQTLIPP